MRCPWPRLGRCLGRLSGHQLSNSRGCQRATQRTRHRRQRHHGGHRPEPALAGRSLCRRSLGIAPTRSPGDMIITLPGKRWRFRLHGVDLWSFDLGSIDLGSFGLRGLDLWRFHADGVRLGRFGLRRGPFLIGRQSRRLDLSDGRYRLIRRRHVRNGRRGAERSGFTAGGLGLLIAHVDSPELIDHLVTFIACQILTGGGLTEILGTRPARFGPPTSAGPVPSPPMLPCGILAGSVCAGLFPD